MLNYQMLTEYGENFNKNNPLDNYPRPSFIRSSYCSLNGIWNYEITKENIIPNDFNKEICVPYVIESSLSSVRLDLDKDDILWYYKKFSLDANFINDHVILHFDGVFQVSEIILNGVNLGVHKGGFTPFSFDIKDYLKGENILLVKVLNTPDFNLGVGKEGKARGGMWYTKTTGIYKSVWLEAYSNNSIIDLNIKTDMTGKVSINPLTNDKSYNVRVSFKGKEIINESFNEKIELKIDNPKLWSPEEPNLYDIIISNENDLITSYFAFRTFETKDNKFYLNGKPYFVNGLLYQPYYSDGIYTPASYEVYKDDIIRMKNLGFNTLRVHIKVEAEMFYYYADKYGILVFQDFPNSGKYNFFIDTVLPTIGFNFVSKNRVSDDRFANFVSDGKTIIKMLRCHPSVVYYTIFNEGWGQFKADLIYDHFKAFCNDYVYDTTSGWFKKKNSDVLSLHIYFKKLRIKKSLKPVIISEFGGYNFNDIRHSFNNSNEYGYHRCVNKDKLTDDIYRLYEKEVIPLIKKGLAGVIYTQVNDVEDETNGLLTYDRKEIKVNQEKIKEIMEKVKYE